MTQLETLILREVAKHHLSAKEPMVREALLSNPDVEDALVPKPCADSANLQMYYATLRLVSSGDLNRWHWAHRFHYLELTTKGRAALEAANQTP